MRNRGLRILALSSLEFFLASCPSSHAPPPLLPACDPAHGDRDCHGTLHLCRAFGGTGEHHCVACTRDSDCDDGAYCNGVERCATFACIAGTPINCSGAGICGGACDEVTDSCVGYNSRDNDSDGVNDMACGGTDCDDSDPSRYPGNVEVCDALGHDEDCDLGSFGERDLDGDGYYDMACCNISPGGVMNCGNDCNDNAPDVHPNLDEACDGKDNDCDGFADEGVLVSSYEDADGDGWGTGEAQQECAGASGRAARGGDCDDNNPQIHPGAFRCAGTGSAIDVCGSDGRFTESTCPGDGPCVPQPDGTGVCLPGANTVECSDGVDNDGDNLVDWQDPDCASPADPSERPERCGDGIDNDGDGKTDFPLDPGCDSREDTSEDDPSTEPACSNGLDDDGDGTVDYAMGHGDPGCVSAADDDERQAGGPACDNGADDDMDGATDFPMDLQCTGPTDNNEGTPACSNGIDDDGDGLVDFSQAPRPKPDPGADPGCGSASDDSERGTPNSPACDNGIDDDGDGAADFPADLGCTGPNDTSE